MAETHSNSGLKDSFSHIALHMALLSLVCITFFASANAAFAVQPVSSDVAAASSVSPGNETSAEFSHYSLTLEQLGALQPIELRSVDGRRTLSFSIRNDEVITAAKLSLMYGWSPALIPELSHLKIMLNDELMTSLPLPREKNDSHASEVQLDPSLLIDFNRLTLGLIAHYTRDCEDPMHSTLWANVSNQSKLDLTVRHLKLPNDLALLPAPFFDRLDIRKLKLPFVFFAQPNNEVLHAAGVVASWFGSLSGYRGAQFPVLINALPKGSNGVVIVMGTSPPAELHLPAITGASLAVVNNPVDANAKLLVIMGRDANELDLAAQALALGRATLTGGYVNVAQLQDIPPRKPYDAPNWIPTDRLVHFSELSRPQELQVEGFTPDSVRVNFNVPPDIFSWRSKGVPLELHYRYTERPVADKSTLNVHINDLLIKSLPLDSVPGKLEKVGEALLPESGRVGSKELMLIPHDKIYGRNQLQLRYFFDYTKQGSCKDVYLYNERGAIDADSSIDFSSFPHYTALPNLNFFANDGFPFTRMADLSETAVVMPDNATPVDMETYLMLMGRMGKMSGYPAIRHVLASAANVDANADKDMIVIGTSGNQPLLARWADQMHPLLENGSHKLKLPGPFQRLMSRWENQDLEDAMHRAGDLLTKGEGGLGALIAFESPLKKGRSVVVLSGDSAEQISALTASMFDPKTTERFHGDLVLQSGMRIEGFQMGPTYYVGKLPWWTALQWYLSKQPLLLFVLAGLAALLVAAVVFRLLRKLAAQRLLRK